MIHQSKARWNGFSLRIEFSHVSKQSIHEKEGSKRETGDK